MGRERGGQLRALRERPGEPDAAGPPRQVLVQDLDVQKLVAGDAVGRDVPGGDDRERGAGEPRRRERAELDEAPLPREEEHDRQRRDRGTGGALREDGRGDGDVQRAPRDEIRVPMPDEERDERRGDQRREQHVDARLDRRHPEVRNRREHGGRERAERRTADPPPQERRQAEKPGGREDRRQPDHRVVEAGDRRRARGEPMEERRLRRDRAVAMRDDPVPVPQDVPHDERFARLAARQDRRRQRASDEPDHREHEGQSRSSLRSHPPAHLGTVSCSVRPFYLTRT